ncbi:unnamed protein product [Urochloa decumbens]|uniref:MINDY deubiquitinase domain-containing protein n=1 Tax=Urochloa decumbens TaxID=240449 RepID=A0ABC8VT50_9POAL
MAKYKVSDMLYHNESKGFLCQSSPCSSSSGKEGCPCALLSVWNYLVLEHGVPCQSNDGYKTEKDICNTLSRKLIEGFNKLKRAGCFGQDSDQMQRKILASMRSLPTGIKLNPAFNSIEDFEMSTATLLFAALGIPLIHGHVIDPKTLSDSSSSNASNQGQAASNEPMNSVALFKTQLTNYGLTRLLRGQKEGELAVLYTNGHYSTTLKKENIMLTLETNEDVLRNAPDAIWRRLTVLDGDSFYLTSRFSPTKSQRNKEKADQWYNQNLKEKF